MKPDQAALAILVGRAQALHEYRPSTLLTEDFWPRLCCRIAGHAPDGEASGALLLAAEGETVAVYAETRCARCGGLIVSEDLCTS